MDLAPREVCRERDRLAGPACNPALANSVPQFFGDWVKAVFGMLAAHPLGCIASASD